MRIFSGSKHFRSITHGSAIALMLSATAWAAGCGKKGGSGDGGGSGAGGEDSGRREGDGKGEIVVPLGGGTGDGDGGDVAKLDGGRVDLTDEEVDAILNAACTGWAADGEKLPVVLQLVVDVSGSMNGPPPGSSDTDPTKWDVTRTALEAAIADLPASVSAGVLFYPNQQVVTYDTPHEVTECVNTADLIPIELLGDEKSTQRDVITQGFADATAKSLTPTYDAYTYALEKSLIPFETTSEKFMLVITDGAPTVDAGCLHVPNPTKSPYAQDAPTDPIVDQMQAAFDDYGIRTFLIGSPGSEVSSNSDGDMRPWLSKAAVAGGTAAEGCMVDGPAFCHLDMTQQPDFAEALRAGLASIAGQIIDSCTFKIPEPPPDQTIDPNLTQLIITWGTGAHSLILRDDIGDCDDGWTLNPSGDIELCGATCDEVKLDRSANASLNFGCGIEDIPIVVR